MKMTSTAFASDSLNNNNAVSVFNRLDKILET